MGAAAKEADAFLCAFNGGMFGGEAVASVLFGDVNPSGRLPISFPQHSGQLPVYYNSLPGWHTRPGMGYCDVPLEPLYAFGQGMGYAGFDYCGLEMNAETLTASVTVENTGDCVGTETVQFYMRDVVSSVITPVRQLIGFKQVTLAPGESARVSMQFDRMAFSLVNRQEQRVVEPGEFILMAGGSSRAQDLLEVSFAL
jgi:beta-glucosidase